MVPKKKTDPGAKGATGAMLTDSISSKWGWSWGSCLSSKAQHFYTQRVCAFFFPPPAVFPAANLCRWLGAGPCRAAASPCFPAHPSPRAWGWRLPSKPLCAAPRTCESKELASEKKAAPCSRGPLRVIFAVARSS